MFGLLLWGKEAPETRLFFKITHLRTNLHNLLRKKGSYATLKLIYYKNNLDKRCLIELFAAMEIAYKSSLANMN